MRSISDISPEQLTARLHELRGDVFQLELGIRGLVRIAAQAYEQDFEQKEWALNEVEAIGELLVTLASTTGTALEPGALIRWADRGRS